MKCDPVLGRTAWAVQSPNILSFLKSKAVGIDYHLPGYSQRVWGYVVLSKATCLSLFEREYALFFDESA